MVAKLTMTYAGGAVFVSSGAMNDGGGFVITAGGKIIPVPPWTGPLVEKELAACVQKLFSVIGEMETLVSSSR